MSETELLRLRLHHQRLTVPAGVSPTDVVRALVALQAQEYAMAKWALGLRAAGVDDATVEAAFNSGALLRTHMLRPTWHFVLPNDIRWLLELTAPRVRRLLAGNDRKGGIDADVRRRSRRVFERSLRGGNHLTRDELAAALATAGVAAEGVKLANLMMHAELDGLLCSGPRRGKQFTYALLDERAPDGRVLARDAALAELARRYFASRGAATAHDFAWWSGLTVSDARAGIATLGAEFGRATIAGTTYVLSPTTEQLAPLASATFLLPDFDEYAMSYRDRGALCAPGAPPDRPRHEILPDKRLLIVDGRIAGTWSRTLRRGGVAVATSPRGSLDPAQRRAVANAEKRFRDFVGRPSG